MVKNSTLIVLVLAILLGGGVYYYNSRSSTPAKSADTPVPVLTLEPADVTAFEIAHPGKADTPAIRFEKQKDDWQIAQPIQTDADQTSAQGIVDQVSALTSSQSEPNTPDRLKAYGLDPAAVSLQIQMKNGMKHTVLIGDKDFTGMNAYGLVDGGKNVSLLPVVLLTSCDKSVDELRDHTALRIDTTQISSFTVKSGSEDFAATKMGEQWKFSKPESVYADADVIQMLLGGVANAHMLSIVSEKPDNLAKYGLTAPAITFTATNDVGKSQTLIISKKQGDNYYARDLARPMIFSVTDDLHTQLSKSFADLRDKKFAQFDSTNITNVEIHNDHGTIAADGKPDGSWLIDSAGPQKGKTALSSKIFDPITALTADEIIDHPGANITAGFAKPAIEIDLTDNKKKRTSITLAKPMRDVVYARTSDGPAVYKLKKQAYDSLNFDASQILP
jgi:hypothetical protein